MTALRARPAVLGALALIAVVCARLAPAAAAADDTADAGLQRVERTLLTLQRNTSRGRDETRPAPSQSRRFSLTEEDVNSYIRFWIDANGGREGFDPRSATVHFKPGHVVSAEAVARIGVDPRRFASNAATLMWLRRITGLLAMDNSVELEAEATSELGQMSVTIRSAKVGGIPLPAALVRSVLDTVGTKQRPPLDLSKPFALPNGIERVEVLPGAVALDVRLRPGALADAQIVQRSLTEKVRRKAARQAARQAASSFATPHGTGKFFLTGTFSAARFLFALAVLAIGFWKFGFNRRRLDMASPRLLAAELARSPDVWTSSFLFGLGFLIARRYASRAIGGNAAELFLPTLGWAQWPLWYYGVLLGSATALVYGIFRIGMGRWTATLGALAFCSSSQQLYILASSPMRDYSRAPFALAIIFLLGLLVRSGRTFASVGILASAIGLTAGLGRFSREELPLFLLPASLVVIFLIPAEKHPVKLKAFGVLMLIFSFGAVVPTPILPFCAVNSAGGFMTPMDSLLGLTRPSYDVGYLFMDDYVASQANLVLPPRSAPSPAPGSQPASFYDTPAWRMTGWPYLKAYLLIFPADFLIKLYAGTLRILGLSFLYRLPPQGWSAGPPATLYAVRGALQNALQGSEVPLFAATMLILLATDLRLALLQLVVLSFWSALSTAQFWGRSYFYLEYFSWWNLGIVAEYVIVHRKHIFGRAPLAAARRAKLERWAAVAGASAGLCGLALLALMTARRYQTGAVDALLRDYARAEVASSAGEGKWRQLPGGTALFPRPILSTETVGGFRGAEFFRADFTREGCPESTLWPVLRYSTSVAGANSDWSRTFRVSMADSSPTAAYFFPAWEWFAGIELPQDQSRCLRSLRRVRNPSRFPFLLSAQVPPAPGPLYQRVEDWEPNRARSALGEDPARRTGPTVREAAIGPDEVAPRSSIVRPSGQGWTVEGYATPGVDIYLTPQRNRSRSRLARAWAQDVSISEVDTDLMIARPRALRKGSYVMLQGQLFAGGFTAGLTDGAHNAGTVSVTTPGRFTIYLPVLRDGVYILGVANKLMGYTSLENRFVIRKAVVGEPL